MQQTCNKCHTPVDTDDAFCRKCGASLAFDTTVIENIQQEMEGPAPEVRTGEIITVGPDRHDLTTTGARTLYNLSKKVASKVSDALKTEQGRKLAQGATALAVAIGVELANQAAGKLVKGTQNNKQTNTNQLATRQPTNMAEAFIKALEDQFTQPAPVDDKPDVEETIIKERVYIKRVWRKTQS